VTAIARFVRTTLVGGVLFLIPVVVLVIIVGKAMKVAYLLVAPLAKALPVESVVGLQTPMFLAIALLVLFCFISGLLARTAIAQRLVDRLESSVLTHIPGYEFVRGMGESIMGREPKLPYKAVLARIEDAWQFGFLVETLGSGHLAVYVPGAPNPYSGSVYLMTPERVRMVDIPPGAAMKCLKRLGAGSDASLRGLPINLEPPE
jgi:uncharacterized membrane protein